MTAGRIVLKSLRFALIAAVAFAAVVLLFHDQICRAMLMHLASSVPGLEANIEKELELTPEFPFSVEIAGFGLQYEDESLPGSRWRVGEVHLKLQLLYMLRGVVYVEQLAVEDVAINIPPMPTTVEEGEAPSAEIRIPFVEELLVERAKVRFQLRAGEPTHEFSIARLQAGMDAEDRLSLEGTGELDQQPLMLAARLGNIEQFMSAREPCPVEATLRVPSWDLEASVSGTLAHPARMRGADLDVEVSTPDLSPLRDVFFPDAPFAGAATLEAHLAGHWHAMAISNLRASVDDGDKFKFTIAGSVRDLQAAEGWDLAVDTVIREPRVARYLLPSNVPAVNTVVLRAGLKLDDGIVRIEDLDAGLTGEKDLSLAASGTIEVTDLESDWSPGRVDLNVHASAGVSALERWLPKSYSFSDTGRVIVKTHIEGTSGALSFKDVDVALGGTEPLRGIARGGFSYSAAQVQAMRMPGPSPVAFFPEKGDVRLDLQTDDVKSVGTLFRQTLPDLGPITGKARLTVGKNGAVRFTNVNIRTRGEHPLTVIATGGLTVADAESKASVGDIGFKMQASGPNAKVLKPIFGSLPVEPGPWTLGAEVTGMPDKLRAENFAFESGSFDTVSLVIDGTVANLNRLLSSESHSPAGVSFKGWLAAASTEHIGAAIGEPLPDVGHLRASFEGRDDEDGWSLSSVDIAIIDDTGLDIALKGKATELLGDIKVDAKLALEVPDLKKMMARMGNDIRHVSAITAEGRLRGDRMLVSFDGRIGVGDTPFEAKLTSDLTRLRAHLAGTMTTPRLRLADLLGSAGIVYGEDGATEKPDEKPLPLLAVSDALLMSNRPFPFEYLRLIDLELEVVADTVAGERFKTDRVHFVIDTGENRHHAHVYDLNFEGGSVSIRLDVDETTDPPKIAIDGRGSNFPMGAINARMSDSPKVAEGLFSFSVDLGGAGHSPHELIATANGGFGYVIEDAKFPGHDLDLLGFDVLDILSLLVVDERSTTVECMIADFVVENGVATSEAMYFHTPKLRAAANGKFDFTEDTMDFVVNVQAKRKLLKKKSVLRIHGPMRNPTIDTKLDGAAVDVAAEGAVAYGMYAVPVVAVPVAGLIFLGELFLEGEEKSCVGESSISGKK